MSVRRGRSTRGQRRARPAIPSSSPLYFWEAGHSEVVTVVGFAETGDGHAHPVTAQSQHRHSTVRHSTALSPAMDTIPSNAEGSAWPWPESTYRHGRRPRNTPAVGTRLAPALRKGGGGGEGEREREGGCKGIGGCA